MTNRITKSIGQIAKRAASFLGYSPTMLSAVGGGSLGVSSAGVSVNREAAMKVAAWKRGIHLVSEHVGKTPYHVKRGKVKQKKHQAWKLVRKWAIRHVMSANGFRQAMTAQAMASGNACAEIIRDKQSNRPLELQILDPGTCRPVKTDRGVRYKIDGRPDTVSPANIIHIKGFGLSGYWGMDPITGYARDALGIAIAQQDYAAGYYKEGGTPTTWAHSQTVLTDDEYNRLKGRLDKVGGLKGALSRAHEIPICEGFELHSLTPTAEQSQLLGSREFSLKDIANALGISVHKLNGDGKSSYKSLEEENRAFNSDTLDGWFCQWEEQYEKLLTEDEQEDESHSVEAVRDSLIRTNAKDRAEVLSKATGGPWMTPAEARDIESLPEIEGTDELLQPLNMTPVTDESGESADDDDDDDDDDEKDEDEKEDEDEGKRARRTLRQLRAVKDVFVRMNKRLATQAVKASGRSHSFPDFLDSMGDKNGDVFRSALQPVAELIAIDSDTVDAGAIADSHVRCLQGSLQKRYDTTPPEQFVAIIAETCEAWERSSSDHAAETLLKLTA